MFSVLYYSHRRLTIGYHGVSEKDAREMYNLLLSQGKDVSFYFGNTRLERAPQVKLTGRPIYLQGVSE